MHFNNILLIGTKRPKDWPDNLVLTGFIYPPPGILLFYFRQVLDISCLLRSLPVKFCIYFSKLGFIELHPDLEYFVTNGTTPIYLGFGSMPAPDPRKLVEIATKV